LASPFSLVARGERDSGHGSFTLLSHRVSREGGRTDLAEGRVAKMELFDYIEGFYNQRRRQRARGSLTNGAASWKSTSR
jgi:hypothetical protein